MNKSGFWAKKTHEVYLLASRFFWFSWFTKFFTKYITKSSKPCIAVHQTESVAPFMGLVLTAVVFMSRIEDFIIHSGVS